jgi:hypothetical protein
MTFTNENQIQNEIHNLMFNTSNKHEFKLLQVLQSTPFIDWEEWLIDEFSSLIDGCSVDNFDDLADLQCMMLGLMNNK